MRFRQIHLDFHTSGLIPGIGSRFDAKAFGAAFRNAHVDSVTVFSKCHHGYSYHPTEVGEMHPGLDFDLLRAQIDALHAVGINAPIYSTATWDELAATNHPEWRTVSPEGGSPRYLTEPNGAGWAFLDYSTPYVDYLCAQVDEIMTRYPDGDGIFMDICFQLPSVSTSAQKRMDRLGLDWTSETDRHRFSTLMVEEFFDRIDSTVHKHNPNTPLFFNSGHIRRGERAHYLRHYTHFEVESLPTAGWGYDHFPLTARYVEKLGLPVLGMTGKFHFHWGEVGGYKKPEALIYECGAILAHGARCSIGDHLHPTGAIDESTMRVIAPAYAWVEQREPWCVGSENRADIAFMSAEAAANVGLVGIPGQANGRFNGPDHGGIRVLLEGQFTHDVVDRQSDLTGYRLLILPDVIEVDDALQARIEAFVAQGGRVLLTGASGLRDGRMVFDLGATWEGRSPMKGGDYLLPVPGLQAEGVSDPLFMYFPSERIRVTDGTSLGAVHEPYFDRTPRHFSGHVNAPSRPEPSDWAAGVTKGGYTWLAHPIFTCYHQAGAVAMLEIAENVIRQAMGTSRRITTTLPRAGRVTLRHQPAHNRDIVHLLHATPALRGNLRGANVQPIQDLITLTDITVGMEPAGPVAAVRMVPEGTAITHGMDDGRLTFTVPRLRGHQMIEVAYS
ncbi:MAG: beta-galactosidase trimerization domain-containing protein [Rubellimicrobium sp.]|nr:beta-galactosidase trimerization domain-containing protein [Rubellimicrobium sp.]